ncbi:hypothetical protein [Proteiniborus sp. MB09-C3]|uniref:hypothetical protein n=1 Tax=Proteiniborus sp. MB09-C3 TaxID=3050072 RepID=UPI0025545FA7|nr:hypothetical protein [Proteiniborus sp. MB09-C3]WIV13719.1 hypothetical protein QO263_08495 [Proteiniborus sp. MB09-C3]
MNKKFKMQIKSAFNIPSPARKDEFLQSINFPKAKYSDFIFSQIGYIRKRIWIMSVSLVIVVLLGLRLVHIENIFKLLWIISSVLPFIALAAVMEISRSTSYNMAELEMSCRHSLADIVLVRLGVIGSSNCIAFLVLLLLLNGSTDYSFWRLGIYMLVPFMLTCTLSLSILNHGKVKETAYVCGGISCFVSVLNSVLVYLTQDAFTDRYLYLWEIIFFVLLILTILQTVKLIKNMEELQWSLQLTA